PVLSIALHIRLLCALSSRLLFLFLLLLLPPTSTLFPYTTLFRSSCHDHLTGEHAETPHVRFLMLKHRQVTVHITHLSLFGMRKRSEEHTSELQSRVDLVCRLLLEKKKKKSIKQRIHYDLI